MTESFTKSRGGQVVATLAGAWRAEPPVMSCSGEELAGVVPLLLGSGAASLGWWKVRGTELGESEAGRELRAAYRSQVLENALREREIEDVFRRLREAGVVDAVLVKGWAAARAYPAEGLRPFGDIDVCVPPGQLARAAAAIERCGDDARLWVDLHDGFKTLDDGDPEELFARAETVRVGATDVRVLGREDHLRILCVHLLKHGAWRPLWLCDVAAMVEGRDEGFDWERVSGTNRRRARWIASAIGLAHALLGAHLEDTPLAGASANLPRWLVPEVLKRWDAPFATRQAPMRHRAPMASYLQRPAGVFADLRNRWPNPIEATISVGGAFNELPRWPFQLANCFARTAHFVSMLRDAPHRRA